MMTSKYGDDDDNRDAMAPSASNSGSGRIMITMMITANSRKKSVRTLGNDINVILSLRSSSTPYVQPRSATRTCGDHHVY